MNDTLLEVIQIIKIVVDICLGWLIFYLVLRLIRSNVRMMLLFKGVLVIVILNLISEFFNLSATGYIIDFTLEEALLILVIIFQPEIRGALEQLGRNQLFYGGHKKLSTGERDRIITEIRKAVDSFSKTRTGAIIVIERDVSLYEYVHKAHSMFSDISFELIASIFSTKSPLHDGAVIIQGDKISCAKAYLPTTTNDFVSESFGTRHRAAIGITEISDAICVVVSEETGSISIAHQGIVYYDLAIIDFEAKIRELYLEASLDLEGTSHATEELNNGGEENGQ